MLRLEGVSRQFGGLVAVQNVALHVPQGKIVGLIGPNGAGKTTLINCMSGLDHPTSGRIQLTVDGTTHEIQNKSAHSITALGLARTFQNIRLLPDMTVRDNLWIAQHGHGRATFPEAFFMLPRFWQERRAAQSATQEMLARFGLSDKADALAGGLSYGDQRRLEMARALALRPHIILLDEPTAGMNATETHALGEQILRMRADGLTVLVIEHDMSLIGQVCDEVYVLNFGQIIAHDTPDAVRQDPAVIEAYLGEEDV